MYTASQIAAFSVAYALCVVLLVMEIRRFVRRRTYGFGMVHMMLLATALTSPFFTTLATATVRLLLFSGIVLLLDVVGIVAERAFSRRGRHTR